MSPKTTMLIPGGLLVLLVIGGFCLWGLSALFRKFGVSKSLFAAVLLLPALAVGMILLSLIGFRSQGVNVQMARESQQRAILQQHEAIQAQHRAIQEHAEQIHHTADANIEHARRMANAHTESSDSHFSELVQLPNETQSGISIVPGIHIQMRVQCRCQKRPSQCGRLITGCSCRSWQSLLCWFCRG